MKDYRKKLLILLLAIIFTSSLLRSTLVLVGPIIMYITNDLGINASQFGLITSIPLIVFAFSCLLVPFISNKYGLIHTIILGVTLIMIGSIFRSIQSYNLILIGTVFLGFGISIGNVLVPAIIKEYAKSQKNLYTGIYLSMQNVFASIASGLAIYITIKVSWSFLMIIWLIPSLIAICFWIMILSKQPQEKKVKQSKNTYLIIKKLFTNQYAWLLSLIMGLQSILYYTHILWLPSIFLEKNFDDSFISIVMMSFQLVAIPGLFLIPIIYKHLKNNSTIPLVSSLLIIIGTITIFLTNISYLNFIAVLATSIGAGNCFAWVVTTITEKTKSSSEASSLLAMSQFIGYLLAAIGPWFGGLIVDLTSSSMSILLFTFTIGLMIFIISLYLKTKKDMIFIANN